MIRISARRTAATGRARRAAQRAGALPVVFAILLLAASGAHAAPADPYIGRPVYSEPATGLQLPPGCEVDPSWRTPVPGSDMEIWIAQCDGEPHVWLLRRQVLEVVGARQARLRFEVLDGRVYKDEKPGDTLSVQCTGLHDETGFVVRGARWRENGRELRLRSASGVLKVDGHAPALVEAEIGAVDCARFPDREAMMKRLQQGKE